MYIKVKEILRLEGNNRKYLETRYVYQLSVVEWTETMNNNHGVIIEETLQDSFIVFFIESCLRYTNDTAFVQQLIVS